MSAAFLNSACVCCITRKNERILKKGIKSPQKVPSYLLRKFFPHVGQTHWRSGNEVKFEQGGYVTHAKNRPEFAASIYYEIENFQNLLPSEKFDKVLEIGCGYGRLSPWIAEHGIDYVGIDIDTEALNMASELHPDLSFKRENVTNLSFSENSFDLIISNTVLHHIPNGFFPDAVNSISSVMSKNGTFIMSSVTEGSGNSKTWVRSKNDYQRYFAQYGFELSESIERDLPWQGSTEYINNTMIFER